MRPSGELGGKRQGRYVLGDLLGRGGMAEVFSGSSMGDHGFQKPVAIKRLLPELANDNVFVDRLISEAKLLVGMQHGNIVSVLDLARDGDDVFLVMDLVDGPSLRQLMKARGSRGLSYGVSSYVIQQAAQGLEFAHKRPGGAIIHADISPSNLLLTTSGEVRVADFGIARREGWGQGIVEGKWAYMAPEQARGEALTPASDVFALGVVLYELLTMQHPFGKQVTPDAREAEAMRVIPPRVVRASIPAGLDAVCMKALAHDQRDRYRSMQQFMDALIDERFTNQYREGSSDLASAIRECAVGAQPGGPPRTAVTERPVTIVTRSLISQPKNKAAVTHPSVSDRITNPHAPVIPPRGSQPQLEVPSSKADGTPAPVVSAHSVSGAETLERGPFPPQPSSHSQPSRPSQPPQQMMMPPQQPNGLPPMMATPLQMQQMPPALMAAFARQQQQAPADEEQSSHHTDSVYAVPQREIPRWALPVLGVAVLVGIVAAVMMRGGGADDDQPAPPPPVAQVTPPLEKAVTAPTPTIETKPAPVEVKPVDPKPADPPPVETKPVDPPPTVAEKPVEKPPVVAEKPVEAKPPIEKPPVVAEKPVVKKPPVVVDKPTRVGANETIQLKVRAPTDLWVYFRIDNDPHRYDSFSLERPTIAPGHHIIRFYPGNDHGVVFDAQSMKCEFNASGNEAVVAVKVDLKARRASNFLSCGN